jgi:4-diphosphocytidyl-2-C-methyl-D-erythritol kinase
LIFFPNCKINLGLYITRKRTDGFHDLETIFYPVQFNDALEVVHHPDANDIEFSSSGIGIPGDPSSNLCVKAYYLLKNDYPSLPGVKMHLHKTIPMGAGLGGGSSDGAFALKLLNEKFNLGISIEKMIGYALSLGSDCPFFIVNKPCIAKGRGEILSMIDLDLSEYFILVVNPAIHVSTAMAFSHIQPSLPAVPIEDQVALPIDQWRSNLRNQFEAPVFKLYPELSEIKETLYNGGAVYASMSGSGSSIYGLFKEEPKDLAEKLKATYSVSLSRN